MEWAGGKEGGSEKKGRVVRERKKFITRLN